MTEEKKYNRRLIIGSAVGLAVTIIGSVITLIITNGINDRREARKHQTEQTLPTTTSYLFDAVINDPDGYTNVRELPTKESTIVDQIGEDIEFKVLNVLGDWCKVESPSGKVGYIYFNRIRKVK